MKKLKFNKSADQKLFYSSLKNKVYSEIDVAKYSYGTISFWIKGLFWFIVAYGSYMSLFLCDSKLYFWILFLIFQLSGLLIGFSLGHDASHNTAFKNKKANQVLHFFSFITVGIDPLLWGLRHIRSHHLYANVEGSDIDIDENPFLRLAPCHKRKWFHSFQYIYAPFVYMLALLHSVFIGDWIYLFTKKYKWMRAGVNEVELYLRFSAFKIFYFLLVLVLPILFTNNHYYFIIITYLTSSAFTSLLFVVMLVGTHFFEEALYPDISDDMLTDSWAVHQLKTSCDWNANNYFAQFLSGGANCHAAHHLFPNLCHTSYDLINPIIEKETLSFQLPYHNKTLLNMMKSHFKHLKEMGKKPKPQFN
ncbi:MAG: fatty acid desaturase [Flavobacterium sp.]|uniref:fatty acid desaturase family protein n=1 Tax=Flavobacterium sp. TaxID=239 RepID=UPI0022C33623|nr:fatty acid desaturase [Flavobacterium sp.]MCZ8197992.1 fatty acid desaturase [Flavobacterium sp.]